MIKLCIAYMRNDAIVHLPSVASRPVLLFPSVRVYRAFGYPHLVPIIKTISESKQRLLNRGVVGRLFPDNGPVQQTRPSSSKTGLGIPRDTPCPVPESPQESSSLWTSDRPLRTFVVSELRGNYPRDYSSRTTEQSVPTSSTDAFRTQTRQGSILAIRTKFDCRKRWMRVSKRTTVCEESTITS
jgi:hypothetical protein